MKIGICCVLLMLLLTLLQVPQMSGWTYNGPEGPAEWPHLFPACAGEHQSPIDINLKRTFLRPIFPIIHENYGRIRMTSFLDNGHTAVLTLPADLPVEQRPAITGGHLAGRYIFEQLHFHWGSNDDIGSEHTINSRPYAGEIHLVHYNSKYGSYQNALNHSDGLAVLGIFLEASPFHNVALDHIINHLDSVTHENEKVTIKETIDFGHLLPVSQPREFYRYRGSLTTPPCSEIVTWTIFREPTLLNDAQLEKFRKLTGEHGRQLVNNDRPVQPAHHRSIYEYRTTDEVLFP